MLRQWQHRGTNPPFEPVQEIEKISLQQLPSPLLSKLINSFKGICLSRLIKRVLGMEYTKDEGVATGRRARINERRGRNLLQVPLHSPFHHRWRALFDKSRAPTPCKQGRRLNKSNYLRKARESVRNRRENNFSRREDFSVLPISEASCSIDFKTVRKGIFISLKRDSSGKCRTLWHTNFMEISSGIVPCLPR